MSEQENSPSGFFYLRCDSYRALSQIQVIVSHGNCCYTNDKEDKWKKALWILIGAIYKCKLHVLFGSDCALMVMFTNRTALYIHISH